MTKRLILILSLALGMGLIASAVYAEVQSIKVGGDLTTLALNRYGFNLTNNPDTTDASGLVAITRVRFDADLTDDVMVTIRLLNERVWGSAEEGADDSDIDIDLASVTLKEFLYSPLTLTIGRQELRLGSGLLIGDPDTNQFDTSAGGGLPAIFGDLSVRKAFDGIVGILDYAPLTLTLGYLKINEGTTAAGAGATAGLRANQDDSNVYIVNAGYDFGTLDTMGELYFIANDVKGAEVRNYGLRLLSSPIENLGVSGEFVYQSNAANDAGQVNRSHSSDNYALLLGADYAMPEMAWSPTIGVDFTRLGKSWNVMFEDQTPADIANAILPNSNLQVIGITATAAPMEDVTARLRFANLRLAKDVAAITTNSWNTPAATSDNRSLGNEFDLNLSYDYTEDVKLGLDLGYFDAGSAYDNRENATQVIGSMKVTF
jgi:hypothetical protein